MIYIRSNPRASGYDAAEPNARTTALWTCLTSTRDFFSAFLSIPPQNFLCTPFHSAHISFVVATASRLLFLGDDATSPNSNRDPDWAVSVARDYLNFDATCSRLAEYYDEVEKVTAALGRRGRYSENEKSVLNTFRDKLRWIRDWYLARTRHGMGDVYSGTYPHDVGRGSGDGGMAGASKDGAGGETSRQHPPAGGDTGGSNISTTAQGGQPMDLDLGPFMMPGELDDAFWQVMFDMTGEKSWMDVQA